MKIKNVINLGSERLKIILIALLAISFIVGIFSTYKLYENNSLQFLTNTPTKNSILQNFANISGGVNNPGIYQINSDTRLSDLIESAGGFHPDADLYLVEKDFNLAEIIEDEKKYYIPFIGENTTSNSPSGKVSINSSTSEQLQTVQGIGPSTANKIIENRPYGSIEDLLNVSGIGEVTLENMLPYISL